VVRLVVSGFGLWFFGFVGCWLADFVVLGVGCKGYISAAIFGSRCPVWFFGFFDWLANYFCFFWLVFGLVVKVGAAEKVDQNVFRAQLSHGRTCASSVSS
jgi:hypothetical protein